MRFFEKLGCLILLCSLLVPAQTKRPTAAQGSASASASPAVVELKKAEEKTPQANADQPPLQSGQSAPVSGGGIEILSDTMGVDFVPYLKKLKSIVQPRWLQLMPESARPPEMKSGTTVLRFEIMRNGIIRGLRVEESAGDEALNRAAYGALMYSNPLPSLPANFRPDYLSIRTRFLYNPAREKINKGQNARQANSKNEQKKTPEADKEKFAPPKQPSQL